jgi:hypothetical protein
MTSGIIAAVVLASLALLIVGTAWRARRWRAGRPAPVVLWRGLAALPRRYLVDVHDVVARDGYAAPMHALTAGGFAASVPLILAVHVAGLRVAWLAWPLLGSLLAMAGGAAMVAYRRLRGLRAQLSGGAWNRLPIGLFAYAVFFAVVTLPAAGLAPAAAGGWAGAALLSAVGVWGCLDFIRGRSASGRPPRAPRWRPSTSTPTSWASRGRTISPGTDCSGSTPASSAAAARRPVRPMPRACRSTRRN